MPRVKKSDFEKRYADDFKESAKKPAILDKVASWKNESALLRSSYEQRWAKNLKLVQGIFNDEDNTRSKVRGKNKIFFRKIWAITWRLLASGYQTFMRDTDTFKIEGRDKINDWQKAGVLQSMVEYRRDLMMRRKNLFVKFVWALQDIVNFGWCAGKMPWLYNPEVGEDGPDFILYPPEQVYPDLSVELPYQMRYIIFESYLTKDDMEEQGYKNINKIQVKSIPNSQVRNARFYGHKDPLVNVGSNTYPRPGSISDGSTDSMMQRYVIHECLYREKGKVKLVVTDGDHLVVLKEPEELPYKEIPAIFGQCLTIAHRLMGEGFPESLEGPQESFNYNVNMRKDNVALALNKHTYVSRYGGVDLQSLVNSRPGGVTLMDDVNAVRERDVRDVTSSAYAEASSDEAAMAEMSGITSQKQGMGNEYKATIAQINYSESNAKIDLFLAIIGETFFRDFYYKLAGLIQQFETDEAIYRIANDSWRKKEGMGIMPDIYNIDDFDADCIVNVGMGTVGREIEVKQLMLAIDRAIMSNQSTAGMIQGGIIPTTGLKMFDITAMMDILFPLIGRKDTARFSFPISAPQQAQQGAPGQNPANAGQMQPQLGQSNPLNTEQMLQQGGGNGI